MSRLRILAVVMLLLLICGGISFGGIRLILQLQQEQIAAQIAKGVDTYCGITLTVEPASVDTYDTDVWSKEYRSSPNEGKLITCYGRDAGRWECNCSELP